LPLHRFGGIQRPSSTKKGLLTHEAWRPTQFGIEMHLLRIHKFVEKVKPQCVVIDPITNLLNGSSDKEVYSMLMRLLDFLKVAGITTVFVSLTSGGSDLEQSTVGVSSLTDTWILLRDVELNGERNRCIYVLKSRGMAHSNQLREFVLTGQGVKLLPVYVGPGGVLTGSSRVSQESRERLAAIEQQQQVERKRLEAARRRLALQAQVATLQTELDALEKDEKNFDLEDEKREEQEKVDHDALAKSRGSK
jgi:circadian clock protein KaiC